MQAKAWSVRATVNGRPGGWSQASRNLARHTSSAIPIVRSAATVQIRRRSGGFRRDVLPTGPTETPDARIVRAVPLSRRGSNVAAIEIPIG